MRFFVLFGGTSVYFGYTFEDGCLGAHLNYLLMVALDGAHQRSVSVIVQRIHIRLALHRQPNRVQVIIKAEVVPRGRSAMNKNDASCADEFAYPRRQRATPCQKWS